MWSAVNMKTAMIHTRRKKFDTWPQFHQAGLYLYDKIKHLTETERLEKAKQLK